MHLTTAIPDTELTYPNLNEITATLVTAVQQLSLARDIHDIMRIVRTAARIIARADGATFVLREGDLCHYADEDAISQLWKGMRFPISTCVSGFAMLERKSITIEDITLDPRIPQDAYQPTFVKSLAMTPIREIDPIGAIGTYWARKHLPSEQQLDALRALADATSIAFENLTILQELRSRVAELESANQRLERMTWLASHDLREPIRAIQLNAQLLESEALTGNPEATKYLTRIQEFSRNANAIVVDLLEISRVENHQPKAREMNLQALVSDAKVALGMVIQESGATIHCGPMPRAFGDPVLTSRVLQNLLANALTFVGPGVRPVVNISAKESDGHLEIEVKDNGVGIAPEYHQKIFEFFTRLQSKHEAPGSGVGLALCKRIIEDGGGRIWVRSEPGKGSSFFFTVAKAST